MTLARDGRHHRLRRLATSDPARPASRSRLAGDRAAVPRRLSLVHPDLPHALEAALFGLAIVGAAFLLSWAAEVAQLDISAGLAIAMLALIAVLPEYAVDFVFAWKGGQSFAAHGRGVSPARRRRPSRRARSRSRT